MSIDNKSVNPSEPCISQVSLLLAMILHIASQYTCVHVWDLWLLMHACKWLCGIIAVEVFYWMIPFHSYSLTQKILVQTIALMLQCSVHYHPQLPRCPDSARLCKPQLQHENLNAKASVSRCKQLRHITNQIHTVTSQPPKSKGNREQLWPVFLDM